MFFSGTNRRKDKLFKEKRHDVYREYNKLSEPSECSNCNAVFSNGRWTWKTIQGHSHKTLCPACRRIKDRYPAGLLQLKGDFLKLHKNEIINLIKNTESLEKEDHPLERIMFIKDQKSQITIATTGIHIARRLGEALSRSYKGSYSFKYSIGEKYIRVFWER